VDAVVLDPVELPHGALDLADQFAEQLLAAEAGAVVAAV
jgi:hypothetical protein